jgi:predicted O-linked N-acetylglucosamine transferase (SPINDLY family)
MALARGYFRHRDGILKVAPTLTLTRQPRQPKAAKENNRRSLTPLDQAFARAAALESQGQSVEACRIYRDILRDDPTNGEALQAVSTILNDVIALYDKGAFEDLVREGNALKEILPNSAALWNAVAAADQALGNFAEAADCFQKAVDLKPGDPSSQNNLGVALDELGKNMRAERAFHGALITEPAYADPYINLANGLKDRGRIPDAIRLYERALVLDPDNAPARAAKLYQQARICDFSWWDEFRSARGTLGLKGGKVPPFSLLSLTDDPEAQKVRAGKWAEGFRAVPYPGAGFRQGPDRKIRVGYIGADFNEHPVARLLARVLELHDRDRFEILAYSYGPDRRDEMRTRIMNAVDTFRDVRELGDEAIAGQAREDALDIAIDLMGYTALSRTGILARRCAPIQISYLGYPGTMAAPFIDYLVADRTLIPDTSRAAYTENILYLPDQCQPQDDQLEIGPAPSRAELGLPEEAFVFCAINNSYKISPEVLDVWVGLLRQIENGVLWLLASNPWVEANLRAGIARLGGPQERVVFAQPTSHARYLAQFQLADLYLDTFSYNAGATAGNALWAGLPVLTRIGKSYPARMAASLLIALGMPELITQSAEEYAALALNLARDSERLGETKRKLEQQKTTSPLFDSGRYTRQFEALLSRAHDLRLSGRPPEDLGLS